MTVCGFTFVRNGVKFDYPFLVSLRSLLPICDRVIVAIGKSDDPTLEAVQSLTDSKIHIIETEWDDSLRTGGTILAQQTNIALKEAVGQWGIYLQADEVLHEKEYPAIRQALKSELDNTRVQGLLFSYKHFYGSYRYIGDSRRWYRREVRAIRLGLDIASWGDAQGFRRNARKLLVKPVDASIYHYGWVKPPAVQQLKQASFNKLWHDEAWMKLNIPPVTEFGYDNGGRLRLFAGTHPSVMHDRIRNQDWDFEYEELKLRLPLRERLLEGIERITGWRIGEYKNYKLI
jgi:hypothetical protein